MSACFGPMYDSIHKQIILLILPCIVVADLCHNQGLATIEEGKAIIENIYRWPDCVVNLQCWKEQETATGTIELLEKYKKLAEATVLRG